MYIAEIYLLSDFTFLLAKYCLGFLYVICIPVITILAQKEIRDGIAAVIYAKSNASTTAQDVFMEELPASTNVE